MTTTTKNDAPKAVRTAPVKTAPTVASLAPEVQATPEPVAAVTVPAIDLGTLSAMSLARLIEEAQATLGAVKVKEQDDLRAKVSEIVEQHGYSIADLFGVTKGKRGGRRAYTPAAQRPGYVAKVYRNPDNPSQEWHGQGRRPNWLMDKIADGTSQEKFLVA
jgi:DNA-binding protein H-NS